MKQLKTRRQTDRGIGVIEFIMVMGLVGGIIAAVIGGGYYAWRYLRLQTMLSVVPTAITEIRNNVGGGMGNYGTGSLYAVVKAKQIYGYLAFPDDASSAFNILGGGQWTPNGAVSSYSVTVSGLNSYFCNNLASRNFGQITTAINGTSFTGVATDAAAAAACTDSDTNSLVYGAR